MNTVQKKGDSSLWKAVPFAPGMETGFTSAHLNWEGQEEKVGLFLDTKKGRLVVSEGMYILVGAAGEVDAITRDQLATDYTVLS